MSRKTVFLGFVMAALIGMVAASERVSSQAAKPAEEGVFIHLKSGPDDPHSVLMALQMAKIMADSASVLLYVDVDGIEVVCKEAPEIAMEPFASAGDAMASLLEKGVTVMACPGCMKAKGVTEKDLLEGVQIANKDAFFGFTSGRILSFSY